jgi:tryptophan synthase alpha chain
MNRIDTLFQEKQENILSIYFTTGHPGKGTALEIIQSLEKHGTDMIEIGMPFSDPLADGPVIQASSQKALQNGMSIKILFEELENVRESVQIPLLLMGYLNPVMQYGMEKFCEKAAAIGIDGIILPDLPYDEYLEHYQNIFEKHGLYNIFLITPQTSPERIKMIDHTSQGFLYLVSSASTTGAKEKIIEAQEAYFQRIRGMRLKNPGLIGFGISSRDTFQKACQHASGAIIGSAFIKALEKEGSLESRVKNFVQSIKG